MKNNHIRWRHLKFSLIGSTFMIIILISFSDCEYTPYSQGETLYQYHCENCHMADGSGLKSLIPPLAQADYLEKNQSSLACLLKNGIKGAITVNGKVYDTEMVGIKTLNDVQINNIINYINNAWGNDYGDSNVKKVKAALETCQ